MSIEFRSTERLIVYKLDQVISKLSKYNVSFDIDGVEAESADPVVRKFNKIFKTCYRVRDLQNYWSLVDWVKKSDPRIVDPRDYAIKLWNSSEVMSAAPVVSGAWLFSNYAKDMLPHVHRITSRPSYLKDVTIDWYKRNMPWVDPKLIHIQVDGDMNIRNVDKLSSHKVRTIHELGVHLHFEDSWQEAEAIVSSTHAKVILVPRPWNLNYEDPKSGIIMPTPNFLRNAPTMISVMLDLCNRI